MLTRTTQAIVALAMLCAPLARAQNTLPTIRAHSRVVTIVDGLHVKRNYWYIMPEHSPDTYYVEIPLEPHRVAFITDKDSISFFVTAGSRHAFVIELDNGVRTLTEIRGDHKSRLPSRRASPGIAEIPFTLGDNDKIYVRGRLNGGAVLDFQVDLGSGGGVIKKSSVPKAQMAFDSTITLRNSDGVNVVPYSTANVLEIADLAWDSVSFAEADNMTSREDGLIGNWLFRDRVIEIDYSRMIISIHDTLPPPSSEWLREDIILDGGTVPFVRGRLAVGDSIRGGWFMLDTGAYTSILNSDLLSALSKFFGEFRSLWGPLGGGRRGPTLSIGGRTFSETNYSVGRSDEDASVLGLMGNDVLKRFDLIIDNGHGAAWFRLNAHADDSFRNPEGTLVRIIAVTGVLIVAAMVWRALAAKPKGVAKPA